MPGIAAATVMGDGRVALILDVDAVVKTNRNNENARPEMARNELSLLEAS